MRHTYTERPKPTVAHVAWEVLSRSRGVCTANPKSMWLTYMDYWVWVMQWSDGYYEDMERCEVWGHQTMRKRAKIANAKERR